MNDGSEETTSSLSYFLFVEDISIDHRVEDLAPKYFSPRDASENVAVQAIIAIQCEEGM